VGFIENKPKAPEGIVFRDYSQPLPERAQAMVALPAIVACTHCKVTGSILMPVEMDYKTGDKIMDGRVVKGFCEGCRQNTEFRALSPEELTENQFTILRRNYEIFKAQQIDGATLPPEVAAFVKAYDEKLQHVMKRKGLKPAAPKLDEPPKIILP
jgi:hypothetical protein